MTLPVDGTCSSTWTCWEASAWMRRISSRKRLKMAMLGDVALKSPPDHSTGWAPAEWENNRSDEANVLDLDSFLFICPLWLCRNVRGEHWMPWLTRVHLNIPLGISWHFKHSRLSPVRSARFSLLALPKRLCCQRAVALERNSETGKLRARRSSILWAPATNSPWTLPLLLGDLCWWSGGSSNIYLMRISWLSHKPCDLTKDTRYKQ